MAYEKFTFHKSYLDAIEGFDEEHPEDAKDFIWAIVWYGIMGKELPTKAPVAFNLAKSLIDTYREKDDKKAKQARLNGQNGGRPKKNIDDNE